jgi:Tol biopolymer transport system component
MAEISGIHLFDVATGEVNFARPTSWTGPFSALEWAEDGKSFVVGQSAEVIAHVSGTPSIVMQYHLDTRSTTPLFWVPLRLPKGSWSATTFALLKDGGIILDSQVEYSQLLEYQVLEQGLSQPRTLISGMSFDRQPVFSPDGKRLLFSSNRSGNIDIWGLDLERGTTSRVTDDPAGDWDPAFSPDGKSLLWSSDRSGNMEIWMGGLDGSAARQVSRDGIDAENPTMTPDAQWIIYASSSDSKSGVWKVRPDGTDAEQLAPGAYLIPEVSPDGQYALFMLVHKLDFFVRVLEVETGRVLDWELDLKVTERDENLVFGRGRWTPDGKGIIYVGQDENGNSGVYLAEFQPDGPWDGNRRKLAGFDPRFTTESLAISPDGQKVVITAVTERRTLQMASHVPWNDR